tara:strand:- start:2183 stop:2536 length:354 start_codon:yes stop_codon:yes gene_type:complete
MWVPPPVPMFCPECGTLAFPTPTGVINCTNYKCGYQGPQNKEFANVQSSTKAETRVYEVIKDSDEMKGVLTIGDYICPDLKCQSREVYSYLEQTRSSDEPETRMLTCKDCGKGWREF